MKTYNHLAVVGRVDGDDEDSVHLYEHMTADEAEQAFREDMLADSEDAGRFRPPEDEIYINYVLTSESPIKITCGYTGFAQGSDE